MGDADRLEGIIGRVAALNAFELGIVGYFTGAALALREARPHYSPRAPADATHETELGRAQRALAKHEAPPPEWLARFHFNSALHRIAALADRIVVARRPELAGLGRAPGTKISKAEARRLERTQRFAPEVECIYQFVNKLKHEQHGSVLEPTFEMTTALTALRSLLEEWEHGSASSRRQTEVTAISPDAWFRVLPQQPGAASPEDKFLRAVRYRWGMVEELHKAWATVPPGAARNALLEAFLIHARVLVDAFYESGSERDGDLTATTVCFGRPEMPAHVREWRDAVNKRAAHLTDVDEAEWYLGPPFDLLQERMARLEAFLAEHARKRGGADGN